MATFRDFTTDVFTVMADNIDDNAGSLGDCFQGLGARIGGFFSGANKIKEDADGLQKYLEYYMEVEDVTKTDLLKILDDVKSIEDDYTTRSTFAESVFASIKSRLNGYQDSINTTASVIVEEGNIRDMQMAALRLMFGDDVDFNAIIDDPESLANAYVMALMRGIEFPVSEGQKELVQEWYDIWAGGDPLVGEGRFTQGFPRYNSGGAHRGIDLGAPIGTPILCIYPGAIVVAIDETGTSTTYGKYVQLLIPGAGPDGGDIILTYAHMDSIDVKVGQEFGIGTQIGGVGNTGRCDPPSFSHLHFDVAVKDGDHYPQLNTDRIAPYEYISPDFVPDYAKEVGPDGEYLKDENGNWVIIESIANATVR